MKRVPLKDLPGFARGVLQSLDFARDKSRAALIALRGDLGAGKTTFVQELAKELGVLETVQSPTYVLMKSYYIPQKSDVAYDITVGRLPYTRMIHIDAYRLKNAKEFNALKPEAFLNDSRALVLIEWPENIQEALPKPDIVLKFSSSGASERERYIEVVNG